MATPTNSHQWLIRKRTMGFGHVLSLGASRNSRTLPESPDDYGRWQRIVEGSVAYNLQTRGVAVWVKGATHRAPLGGFVQDEIGETHYASWGEFQEAFAAIWGYDIPPIEELLRK